VQILKKYTIRAITLLLALQLLNLSIYAQDFTPIFNEPGSDEMNINETIVEYVVEVVLGHKNAIPEQSPEHKDLHLHKHGSLYKVASLSCTTDLLAEVPISLNISIPGSEFLLTVTRAKSGHSLLKQPSFFDAAVLLFAQLCQYHNGTIFLFRFLTLILSTMKMHVFRQLMLSGCLLTALFTNGQPMVNPFTDSVKLSIDSAESIFLKNNYQLLAQRYNIDMQKAMVIQARLYPNPNITINKGFYQTQTKQILANGSDGETSAALSQLIILAGKRNKQVKIAETNATLAEYQFYDLIRTLKYTLRTDFFTAHYQLQSLWVYADEINALQRISDAYQQQQGKGYIAEKEVIRIKAQLASLQSEYNDLLNQYNDNQSEIRTILQIRNSNIIPILAEDQLIKQDPFSVGLAILIDTAYKQRTDLKIARTGTELSRQVYTLQKAMAVPDITVQLGYDQQGSYIHDFNYMGFGIDIPIFNRNQGNIKSAKAGIAMNQSLQKSLELSIEEQVARAWQKAIDNDKLYRKTDPGLKNDFRHLIEEVLINYQKRNIGLLEFLDFYDAYKQHALQNATIQLNKITSLEDINYYTGNPFFN